MSVIKIQGINEKKQGIHYEVDTEEKPLGIGGMGQVYKGCRIQDATGVRMDVAIKFLFDDLSTHIIERARREASVQIHNENLVAMYGFIQIDEEISPGVTHPRYHVVSELLHGVMLYDLLKGKTTDHNGIEIPFAQELYRQYTNDRYEFSIFLIKNILSGIMALHDKGYIHRDLDPSNIMITSDKKVKIIDFGIAKQLSTLNTQDQQLTTNGQFMGKAAYAAPELVVGDVAHQNETTDIYAVGIMFFQFIVGHLPFDGPTHEVLEMQLHKKMPLKLVDQKQIRKIIAKATAKKQMERYQSASEFRVAVEQLEKQQIGKPTLKNDSLGKDKKKNPIDFSILLKNKKIVISACVAVFAIIGIWGWVHLRQTREKEEIARAEAEHQNMLAERREKMKDEIIDASDAFSKIDTLSGCTIKSSALLINEATDCLLNPAKADEGLGILSKVIAKKYRTSSDAAYLMGRLYAKGENPSEKIQAMKSNLTGKLSLDNKKAHEMNRLALELDSTSFKALYELGCDYYAGGLRTGGGEEPNIAKALNCFTKALKFATQANNAEYKEKCSRRIKELSHL